MNKLYKVEDIVKEILENYVATRDDDFLLTYHVFCKVEPSMAYSTLGDAMCNHKAYKLPCLESISRARRKLQAQYEELRASKEVEDARLNETAEYINYAIDGYDPKFMDFVNSQD